MFSEIEHFHDNPKQVVDKLFNSIQHLRCDLEIMRGSKTKIYPFSDDDVKVAEALVREIKSLHQVSQNFKNFD